MNKVSDVLAERFSQDPLEIYFSKHPPGASINKLPLLYQKVFKPIATLPYFNSSCQPSIFHSFITSLISVCFVVMKNFSNRYIKSY